MSGRIIRLEVQIFVDSEELERRMRLVPTDQRDDSRLELDGLVATQVYLFNKFITADKLAYRGSLYDFLCEDATLSGDLQDCDRFDSALNVGGKVSFQATSMLAAISFAQASS